MPFATQASTDGDNRVGGGTGRGTQGGNGADVYTCNAHGRKNRCNHRDGAFLDGHPKESPRVSRSRHCRDWIPFWLAHGCYPGRVNRAIKYRKPAAPSNPVPLR